MTSVVPTPQYHEACRVNLDVIKTRDVIKLINRMINLDGDQMQEMALTQVPVRL